MTTKSPAEAAAPAERALYEPRFSPRSVAVQAIPFVATFQSAKAEHAAVLLVLYLAARVGEWAPVDLEPLQAFIAEQVNAEVEPIASFARNPFFKPDFQRLIEGGFARKRELGAIEFTAEGLRALEPWVPTSAIYDACVALEPTFGVECRCPRAALAVSWTAEIAGEHYGESILDEEGRALDCGDVRELLFGAREALLEARARNEGAKIVEALRGR